MQCFLSDTIQHRCCADSLADSDSPSNVLIGYLLTSGTINVPQLLDICLIKTIVEVLRFIGNSSFFYLQYHSQNNLPSSSLKMQPTKINAGGSIIACTCKLLDYVLYSCSLSWMCSILAIQVRFVMRSF